MQPVDYTTLVAVCRELQTAVVPARLEQVYQRDRHSLSLGLRTLSDRPWLLLSWHPEAARLHLDTPPPRDPDTFTLSQQLQAVLKGFALIDLQLPQPWERIVALSFGDRPGDPPRFRLLLEVMGKYSNLVLLNADGEIVTVAHQVSDRQSRLRTVRTGEPYEWPPALTTPIPNLDEPFERWRDRLQLVPGRLDRQLIQCYRGLSSRLVQQLCRQADLDPQQNTAAIAPTGWQQLHSAWQDWLRGLQGTTAFQPQLQESGYRLLPTGPDSADSVNAVIATYYDRQLLSQQFQQLRQQLSQRLQQQQQKLQQKQQDFQGRLDAAEDADRWRQQGDLLMASLDQWQPGLESLSLPDFETGEPQQLQLDPALNAVQNAQRFYRRHQKAKRSRQAVLPLLAEVEAELRYLDSIAAALAPLQTAQTRADWLALQEIREELAQQGYWPYKTDRPRPTRSQPDFLRYQSPSGYEVWVGRNNRQNEILTFQSATDYDLWFHAQEIPGSHVLLRLPAGDRPDPADLQFSADLAALHSRAAQADQVPVVWTEPRNVWKPKGAHPGMVLYRQERVIWAQPQQRRSQLTDNLALSTAK
ncbi:NFACT RNA binding domain-containing protein [Synechococcus elongatus IITB4]|uniref:Rqc2 family fibronectin-binding protein n=1 Tax=Synechococcus elongatus TaxID=32046 RepID=UPI0030CD4DB6